jgi:BASS family bile acid:Na+ symporter
MSVSESRPAALSIARVCLWLAAVSAGVLALGAIQDRPYLWRPAAVVLAASLAISLREVPALRGYQFTAWIAAAVASALIYPDLFLHVGHVDLSNNWLIVTVIQLVMFGMGTQMSLHDFAGIAKMPWSVFVGILCHFTIMPLVGFGLTRLFSFPDEIAAGVILVGCCSSGLASNVMAYLARADLVLSITVTSVTTMMAPVMTPFWMKMLAGDRVEISFLGMMFDIIKLLIVPIGAALLHDYLKRASARGRRLTITIAILGAGWFAYLGLGGWEGVQGEISSQVAPWVTLANYVVGAVVAGVAFHALVHVAPVVERRMPLASMFGIIYFTAVTTAKGRDDLLAVGGLLFVAAAIHNALGYLLGYGLSRTLGVNRTSARTISFEVGLQNGGMASGIAAQLNMLGTMGLAAAVFSPWMNITGSILANYWRKRPVGAGEEPREVV